MTLRIAINGFGRIGRNVLRALYTQNYRQHLQVVAINDLGPVETNDVYLVILALAAITLIVLGNAGHAPLQWVGAGVAAFGVIYVVVHDGIVHRHWPLRPRPRHPYLRRLYQAHLMHHAVKGRKHSVSFGFLYAPPIRTLKQQLRARRVRQPGSATLPSAAASSTRCTPPPPSPAHR